MIDFRLSFIGNLEEDLLEGRLLRSNFGNIICEEVGSGISEIEILNFVSVIIMFKLVLREVLNLGWFFRGILN